MRGEERELKEAMKEEKDEQLEVIEEKSLPIKNRRLWAGTPTQLLKELENQIEAHGETVADWRAEGFPKSAKALGKQLRQLVPNFVESGVRVSFDRLETGGRTRIVKISTVEKEEQTL